FAPIRAWSGSVGMLIVSSEHKKCDVFVGGVHQGVQIAALEHGEMTGTKRSRFESTLALRHLAPVTHDHKAAAFEHQEDLLIVAMAVQSDTAFGLQNMQIHIVHRHERFDGAGGVFLAESIEAPGWQRAAELAAALEAAVVGKQI